MLHSIKVHNFRSLDNFQLNIAPGLNVLVGPNGAGKTSIMKWFEFLSLLSTFSLRESIGKIGGANHVFRRKGDKYLDDLTFSFCGSTEFSEDEYKRFGRRHEYKNVYYEYEGSISTVKNQIFFSRQKTSAWISRNENTKRPDRDPDIFINWSYDILTNESKVDVKTKRPRDIEKNSIYGYYFDKDMLSQIIKTQSISEYLIIPARFLPLDYLHMIKEDLSYRKAYNINPAQVRSVIDISSQPGVQFDGAGTVSTVYDIYNNGSNAQRYTMNPQRIYKSKNSFSKVISYFKLSDKSINDVKVDIDNFRNEFTLEVSYAGSSSEYAVPLSLLSDGTVKWLALVAAVSTERQSLFIEEPENFLHPKLQESIVEIIREEIASSETQRFAFITTHSETLLNKLNPSEIIVTSMIDGRTAAERISDPQEISQIIADSGFGLGYFYVSGGF